MYRMSAVVVIVLISAAFGTIQYFRGERQQSCAPQIPDIAPVETRDKQNRQIDAGTTEEVKMAEVMEVTQATFEESVLKSDLPVLVDFWAPWCGPCRMLGPIVGELAKDYTGKLKVVKVNTDEHPGIAGNYSIRGIPTLIFFKDGKEVDRVVGVQPKAQLAAKIDTFIEDS